MLTRDGSIAWSKDLDQPVFVSRLVADLTRDGTLIIILNHGRSPSTVVCFDEAGNLVWEQSLPDSITWWTLTHSPTLPGIFVSVNDRVVSLNGQSGAINWKRRVGRNPAVGAVDQAMAYVTVRDGTLRALSFASGSERWRNRLTDNTGYSSAPILGQVMRGEERAVIAAARDGTIGVFSAQSGNLLAREKLSATLYTSPRLLDVPRDGSHDIVVMTGSASVRAFTYTQDPN